MSNRPGHTEFRRCQRCGQVEKVATAEVRQPAGTPTIATTSKKIGCTLEPSPSGPIAAAS